MRAADFVLSRSKVPRDKQALRNFALRASARFLRLIPGSAALRIKRDLRDSAWLSEADAVIVSYPKSGRTFIRAMLSRLYQRRFGIDERRLLEFPLLRRAPPEVPRVLFTHAGDAMRSPDQVRIDAAAYEGRPVVLVARHPGDIAVSRFHHLKHRSRDKARRRLAKQPLDSFVWAEQGGIPSIVTFLNQFAALPGVTIIRYEDFLADPRTSFRKLAAAICLPVSDDDVDDAVEFASLASLKQRERDGYFLSARLRHARKGDEQSGKVRSGTSGGYRAQLDAHTVARINSYLAEKLDPRLGYTQS